MWMDRVNMDSSIIYVIKNAKVVLILSVQVKKLLVNDLKVGFCLYKNSPLSIGLK